jgi:hypothetical protein
MFKVEITTDSGIKVTGWIRSDRGTRMSLADFIREKAKGLNGFIYSSKPFSCGLEEALIHFHKYEAPKKYEEIRTEKSVEIIIKALKGSRKRKPYKILLWVA